MAEVTGIFFIIFAITALPTILSLSPLVSSTYGKVALEISLSNKEGTI